ncbi:hypothetical protein [Nostoc sp.]|uniref:hypothetical protein n=1 Tax=Nostoc sp. TaxID=1180 RepID=UPI00359307AC
MQAIAFLTNRRGRAIALWGFFRRSLFLTNHRGRAIALWGFFRRSLIIISLAAIADYAPDSELNIFSDLEGEDFCDYPDEDLHNSKNYVQR